MNVKSLLGPSLTKWRGMTARSARQDAMAGLSVAAVALPVGLAYASMMGLPAASGLWAAIAGMLGYAVFGASRTLVVGPDTATCTLIAATLTGLSIVDPQARLAAAAGMAVVVGLGCLLARMFRLGVLANLLSRPVLVGYMAGVAITLACSQLGTLTGAGPRPDDLLRPFEAVTRLITRAQPATLILGLLCCTALAAQRVWRPRWPGAIILVAVTCLLSWLLDFPKLGVAVVGDVPAGLPAFTLPEDFRNVPGFLLGAAGVLLVSFSSGIVTARSFATVSGEEVEANRELVGLGASNLASGLFQGFVVTGADSRTAVSLAAGASSPLASVVAALTLAVVLSVATGLLYWLPQATLAVILLFAAMHLFQWGAFVQLARISRAELGFAMLAAVGVVIFGVLGGVITAVTATLMYVMYVTANPRDALLGRLPGDRALCKLHLNPTAEPVPETVIWLFESSIWFFNADAFRRRARDVVSLAGNARWFILDAEAMTHADADAVDALFTLKRELQARDTVMMIAGGHGLFRTAMERSGLIEAVGAERVFVSVEQAVAAIERHSVPV
ncbi:inorganic anion transporter, SulP family [Bordetella holmesii CDC-H635-BH]|nr:SulP family inorganic anion transporter [Bordetella holmesii]AMD48143.1 sulfate transporter [Bordetella holmesii F627]KAK97333.1 inorganic anion transporter, SulP family [Bordetella holmesii CDC-H635-BH]KCV04157.1 inorganic anion transporter, SulP family [Bordetella holmesii CDC-H719-BH]KCV09639.1 inorganic anion transporter, SulP family [Bordetella holmesii 04P3421]MBO1240310.1 SulP family inorganic anion transporter [Bordetella holmesii]